MDKVNLPISNDYCPQTLFCYGTFREDGQPDFGLFCWLSYCWLDKLGIMAAIGGPKLTLDRIHAARVFSANLVTEELLPLADYFGTANGYSPDKMDIPFKWQRGAKLDVPVLSDSPVNMELEVVQFVPLEGSEVMICRIANVLGDAALAEPDESAEAKLARMRPVSTTCMTYFGWNGARLAAWHEPGAAIRRG